MGYTSISTQQRSRPTESLENRFDQIFGGHIKSAEALWVAFDYLSEKKL